MFLEKHDLRSWSFWFWFIDTISRHPFHFSFKENESSSLKIIYHLWTKHNKPAKYLGPNWTVHDYPWPRTPGSYWVGEEPNRMTSRKTMIWNSVTTCVIFEKRYFHKYESETILKRAGMKQFEFHFRQKTDIFR